MTDNSQKFIDLMGQYKEKRAEVGVEKARHLYEEAMALVKAETVSEEALEAARYL